MPTDDKKDERFFQAHWLYLLAGVLLLGCLAWMHRHPKDDPWHGVAEALCIASLLTIFVDPFVKKRLMHEVHKGIFYSVIGFDLPPEMQDRLRIYLRGLKYYRSSLAITVEALPCEGEEVVMKITLEGKVVALTRCKYPPSLVFEAPEHGQVQELWARRTGEKEMLCEWTAGTPMVRSDPLTMKYAAPVATLKRGETLDSCFIFTLRQRKQDYWVQTFGTTTLTTTVTLKPLPGMTMYASDMTSNPENTYVYDRVHIMGEDIRIRWAVADGK